MDGEALYNEILTNGLGLTSPSFDLTVSTINKLNEASTAVSSLPIAEPPLNLGVTRALVDDTLAAITTAASSVTGAQNHMQTGFDNLFSTVNLSSSVSTLENQSGCGYLDTATGSLTGGADHFLTDITGIAQNQIDAVNQYLTNAINEAQLTTTLTTLNATYGSIESDLQTYLNNEVTLFNELSDKMQSAGIAKSLALMYQDPCTKTLLDQTLSDDIKAILNG